MKIFSEFFPEYNTQLHIYSDGLTKREARCKKSKGEPLFSVLRQSNL